MAFKLGGGKMGLMLQISLNDESIGAQIERTFRKDGLSIAGDDCVRVNGLQIPLEVDYDDLVIGKKIGQGACSSVYVAVHKYSNKKYAVKIFNTSDRGQAGQLGHEMHILTQVDCESLTHIKGISQRL